MLEAECLRREQLVKDEVAKILARIPEMLSSTGKKIELVDKSNITWDEADSKQLKALESALGESDLNDADAKKLGLKKLEIVGNGTKLAWVQAEKKLVIGADFEGAESVAALNEVIKRELARR